MDRSHICKLSDMADEEASASYALCPVLSSSEGSSPSPVDSSSSESRRARSVSINLPPDPELITSIGSRLRRLSDEFLIRRQLAMVTRPRRRQTIGNITQLNGLS